jgi:hypothetical protein
MMPDESLNEEVFDTTTGLKVDSEASSVVSVKITSGGRIYP